MADDRAFAKLEELLGFDPAKTGAGNAGVLQEAIKEINEENNKQLKQKAKDLLVQAMDLRRKMDAASKEFRKQEQKFAKELGKLLNRIEQMAQGRSGEPEEEEKKEESN
jgi:uncharacterized phage infection (PIP) family protein YhgE